MSVGNAKFDRIISGLDNHRYDVSMYLNKRRVDTSADETLKQMNDKLHSLESLDWVPHEFGGGLINSVREYVIPDTESSYLRNINIMASSDVRMMGMFSPDGLNAHFSLANSDGDMTKLYCHYFDGVSYVKCNFTTPFSTEHHFNEIIDGKYYLRVDETNGEPLSETIYDHVVFMDEDGNIHQPSTIHGDTEIHVTNLSVSFDALTRLDTPPLRTKKNRAPINLVRNGTGLDGFDGWSDTWDDIDGYPKAGMLPGIRKSGFHFVELGEWSYIGQDISTIPGETYTLSVTFRGNNSGWFQFDCEGSGNQSYTQFSIVNYAARDNLFNPNHHYTYFDEIYPDGEWHTLRRTFVATTSSLWLGFGGNSLSHVYISEVMLVEGEYSGGFIHHPEDVRRNVSKSMELPDYSDAKNLIHGNGLSTRHTDNPNFWIPSMPQTPYQLLEDGWIRLSLTTGSDLNRQMNIDIRGADLKPDTVYTQVLELRNLDPNMRFHNHTAVDNGTTAFGMVNIPGNQGQRWSMDYLHDTPKFVDYDRIVNVARTRNNWGSVNTALFHHMTRRNTSHTGSGEFRIALYEGDVTLNIPDWRPGDFPAIGGSGAPLPSPPSFTPPIGAPPVDMDDVIEEEIQPLTFEELREYYLAERAEILANMK